ncbi:GPN-loop GTPase 3 like protein [Microstroma glucosiphilum]|uniref:GPN-loop GTPase 3 n=1 Tax=Pseudomicrostroma glucosiphilum TaxID=1684307 RepID=A0A316U1P2_9BASI|nr:GPN-loop GTPase 3 like protein [Pseudomicrostroma glucosiphilum]PWN18764.1 GPN-loop GTPase 3 like protein [Pseudomicrostroma glucosiphilum]
MGRYAVLVSGPAGSGKSTLCSALIAHANTLGRTIHLVNLDPAAERFSYTPSIDVRELITLEDVMDEMKLGPNGGLVYCFEYLLENLDWLDEQLGGFEDDYLIIDCPGQIELYTHTALLQGLLTYLSVSHSFRLCQLYLLESHFVDEVSKFFAGTLSAMSAMINLEVPWINVMSKMDLVERGETASRLGRGLRGKREMERYLDPDPLLLTEEANASTNPRFHSLNQSLVQLIDDFAMINFMPLDATSEDSVGALLSHIDHAMQSQEDEEPKEPRDMDKFEVDEGGGDELEDDETRMEAMLEREMERRAGGGIGDVEI